MRTIGEGLNEVRKMKAGSGYVNIMGGFNADGSFAQLRSGYRPIEALAAFAFGEVNYSQGRLNQSAGVGLQFDF